MYAYTLQTAYWLFIVHTQSQTQPVHASWHWFLSIAFNNASILPMWSFSSSIRIAVTHRLSVCLSVRHNRIIVLILYDCIHSRSLIPISADMALLSDHCYQIKSVTLHCRIFFGGGAELNWAKLRRWDWKLFSGWARSVVTDNVMVPYSCRMDWIDSFGIYNCCYDIMLDSGLSKP